MAPPRRARTTPEWVTLAVSVLVVAVVIGLLVIRIAGGDEPALPEVADVGTVEARGRAFHVPVAVHNRGDQAAQNVQVTAELIVGGDVVSADQVIDFLGADETEELVFVFPDDPSRGELTVEVSSFADP